MREIDISGISVQTWMAAHHHWWPGQSFRHIPTEHLSPAMLYHLWLVQDGCVEVESGGRRWQVASGEACLLPATLERIISTPKAASWLSLGLRVALFNRFDLLENLQSPVQWRPDEEERGTLAAWMERIVQIHRRNEAHERLMVNGLSTALLGLCWPHLSSESLDSPIYSELPHWLTVVLRHISQEPACTIADLAHAAGFSPAQFRRTFHKWVGVAPRDYLKKRRMETAQHLLETTDLSLRAIATQVGLTDVAHFTASFKAAYGLSPAHYRAPLLRTPK